MFTSRVALALVAVCASTTGIASAQVSLRAPTLVSSFETDAVLPLLVRLRTIGSAVDPMNGDQNPYGLTLAPASQGLIKKGDLVVCDFNDAANIQGLGTSIEILRPFVGAVPEHLISAPQLTGCAAIAMGAATPWATGLEANDAPIVSTAGSILTPINTFGWTGPWGETFVAPPGGAPAFYVSNANDGSIVRINLGSTFTFDKIASGFPVNHGVPGSILAPSGLSYDAAKDKLYVVDGATNAIFSIRSPGTIPTGGIKITLGGFIGPFASRADVVFSGAPLNAPISAALLFNGDLAVGNTGNNKIIELAGHRVVAETLVDKGPAGAIFGMVASGTSAKTTRLYFNDDNSNTVEVLSR
jgi:hypothetical protein